VNLICKLFGWVREQLLANLKKLSSPPPKLENQNYEPTSSIVMLTGVKLE